MNEKEAYAKIRFYDRTRLFTEFVVFCLLLLFITLAVYNTDQNMKLEAALKVARETSQSLRIELNDARTKYYDCLYKDYGIKHEK